MPLTRATVSYPGTNQVVSVSFGTNHLANFPITPEQQQLLNSGTNRFAAVTVEPLLLGRRNLVPGPNLGRTRRERCEGDGPHGRRRAGSVHRARPFANTGVADAAPFLDGLDERSGGCR